MTRPRRDEWSLDGAPDQTGRVAVVTGANTGVGFAVARLLAERGATVVLACRDPAKAEAAAARIGAAAPGSRSETLRLDLASLTSVRAAAAELRERHPRIDLLVNNAAVMHPRRVVTDDGFELHLATNHLGPFAFTGLVLDRLLAVPRSRVVSVSSGAHRSVRLDLDDLMNERGFRPFTAYGRSKLAALMCAVELQRRLVAAGAHTISVAGDPGACRTEIMRSSKLRVAFTPAMRPLTSWILQAPEQGALDVLRAALDPALTGGELVGPSRPLHLTGRPVLLEPGRAVHDAGTRTRLWTASEQLTGVTYPVGPAR